ncbi:YhdP family protein [Pseudomonas sp. 5P_3.1_Bac2]|uniref:YhdP family protein n=1 Tax=Pseudomonas sp. 5P_3.1_Bac2 TaxID=2971617 RepID=UPI0021C71F8C|nr:YhdP family protein [Pseudomonas sp. 5P_3.1_Bac2]MCU1715635.1 TIGR02099 family protein [Pseudomonas sp. 5P_3.1_Bac2]
MALLLRALALLLRGGLGLCALVLVLAALYVSLGRELIPLVAEYRQEAEDKAREALNLPVQIGALEGTWKGFAPVLLAHDLQLGEGADALQLKQVRVVPDVLGSLLTRQLQIAHVEIAGLHISAVQAADGSWVLEGLPKPNGPTQLDAQQLFNRGQMVKALSVLDSQVTVHALDHPAYSFSDVSLSVSNGRSHQRLDARLALPDGKPLALQLRTQIQPAHWQNSSAQLYLSLPQSDWAQWLPASVLGQWQVKHLQFGGELWLDWADGAVQKAASQLHGQQFEGAYAQRKAVALHDLSLDAYAQRSRDGLKLIIDDLGFSRGEQRWGEVEVQVEQQPKQWLISANRIDLAPLQDLISALAPMPDKARDIVDQLKPHGELSNLQFVYLPESEASDRLQFSANLHQVGISSWHGVPAVENVTGSITGDLGHGELRMATEEFSLHLDTLFPKPWIYHQANAQLFWEIDQDAFTLRSPYMQVVGDEGPASGDMLIRLRFDPAQEDYMDLRVGLRGGDARYTEKYLPSLVPGFSKDLDHWLKTAIRGGVVDEGFFQYQGSLNKGAEAAARSLTLFFAVHDAELAFQPGWPSLQKGTASVFIEPKAVRIELAQGRLFNSQVTNAQALIGLTEAEHPIHLLLKGDVHSSLPDALKILQETPLGTSEVFAGWKGEGALRGKLDLNIPLYKGKAPDVVVDFSSDNASLAIANPALQFTHLSGAFRYDTAKGLSGNNIRAQLFGQQVRAKAHAEGSPGRARTRIDASGQIAVQDLSQWLGVQQDLPVSGKLPYQLRLTIDGDDSQLRVDSNLKGVTVALPEPFAKRAEDLRPSIWRMTLGGSERRYWLDYDKLLSLSFAAKPGQFNQGRGEIRLSDGPALLPTSAGLRVRGRVSQVDLAAWQQAVEPYMQTAGGGAQQLFKDAQVRVGRFNGFGTSVDGLEVGLSRNSSSWLLDLDSVRVKGHIGLPTNSAQPISVKLAYLRFPAAQKDDDSDQEQAPDILADVDPRKFPALDVAVENVYQGDDALGAWSFKARPKGQGVQFSELALNLKGLNIAGQGSWQHSPSGVRTSYEGRLSGKDLSKVLAAWGYAPSVSSESFRLDVSGNWPGSPAWFSLQRFSGMTDISMRKGQFTQVDGSASALRVFGLLNFDSIGRRLRLDFSDLVDKGLSYDKVKGVLAADRGVFVTRKPIAVDGPSSNLELDGTLNLAADRIDAKLLVTLPVSNNLPLAALIIGAPAIGGALFVVDKLLGNQVARFASVQYNVRGPWQSPEITFDKPFEKPKE